MAYAQKKVPKLPVQQLAILAVVRFAEPMALTSVFPYLPEMIESFGVPKEDVASWAGLTGATFSMSQSVTAILWGWAADSVGRKPTILLGLLCTMVCFVFFGTSTSLFMAILSRAIAGGGNGNVGIIRTMVAEMVPEKILQPKAFSLMPLVWSIGSVFGPAFGGLLARPAERYPNVFGNSRFLKEYPFALPNIVACVFFGISIITATLFLKETLDTKKDAKDWGLRLGEKLTRPFRQSGVRAHRRSFVDAEATAPLLAQSQGQSSSNSVQEFSTRDIFTYETVLCLVCYTFLALHSVAFDQVLPVFLNYPRQEHPDEHNTQLPLRFVSGFGLTSDKIGTVLTVYGIACGLVQFFVFPPLCTRFGAANCFRYSSLVFPFVYMAMPFTALIDDVTLRYAVFLTLLLIKGCVVITGFPSITILLTNSAPSLKVLGTLNGFATTFSGIGRAIGPAATGATFTWGVKNGYIISGMWLLAFIAFVGAIPTWFIVEGAGPSGAAEVDESEYDMYEDAVAGDQQEEHAEHCQDRQRRGPERREPGAILSGDGEDLIDLRGQQDEEIIPVEPEENMPPLVAGRRVSVARSSTTKATRQ